MVSKLILCPSLSCRYPGDLQALQPSITSVCTLLTLRRLSTYLSPTWGEGALVIGLATAGRWSVSLLLRLSIGGQTSCGHGQNRILGSHIHRPDSVCSPLYNLGHDDYCGVQLASAGLTPISGFCQGVVCWPPTCRIPLAWLPLVAAYLAP